METFSTGFLSTCLKQVRVSVGDTFWKWLCFVIYQYCISHYIKQQRHLLLQKSFQTFEKAVDSDPAKTMQNATESKI